nr:reverse transcriptase domain-containing protein [Tanacetum cinerariifolium]
MSYIQDVPEVMQISAFMSNSKCLKLARRFSDQVLWIVTEMMKSVDDFIKSEEDYRSTKFIRREFLDKGQGTPSRRNRPSCTTNEGGQQGTDNHNNYNNFNNCRDHYQTDEDGNDKGKDINKGARHADNKDL